MRALVFAFVFLGACQVSLPEGQITCGILDDECPEGWGCNAGFCRPREDGGTDVGPDSEIEVGLDVEFEPDVVGPPPRDVGPGDVGPGDARIDARDAGPFDSGPLLAPPGNAVLISSDAPLTLDAMTVQGSSVYAAGSVNGAGEVDFGNGDLDGDEAGIWVARYVYDSGMGTLTLDWFRRVSGEATVTSLALADGQVVVGGSFTSLDVGVVPLNPDQAQGFLLQTSFGGTPPTLLGTIGTANGPASVDAMDAVGTSLCAVGSQSGGTTQGSFELDGGAGFIACFSVADGIFTPNVGVVAVMNNPPRDIVLYEEGRGFVALQGDRGGEAFGVNVPGSNLEPPWASWTESNDALLVDHVSEGPVLFGPSSEGHTLAVGLLLMNDASALATWDASLPSRGGTVVPSSMAVVSSVVHVVGRQTGVADLPAAGGFHATFRSESRIADVQSGGASIDVVAGMNGSTVLGGRFIGETDYPARLEDRRANTLFLIVQTSL